MTSTTFALPSLRVRRPAARTVLTAGIAISLLVLAGSVLGLLLDPHLIGGAPAWVKPAKFGLSSALYAAGLRYVLDHLRGGPRRVAAISVGVTAGLVLELGYVSLQVLRGTTSHFNESTVLDAGLFYAAGGIISGVFMLTVVAALLVLRQRDLDPGLAAGLRWGVGVCLVGMAAAGLMIANKGFDPAGAHTVGAPDGGPGLPFLGWSTQHGDLRIPHFVGLHALQALPLLAWGLGRTALAGTTRARLVAVAGSTQLGLVVLLAWQAERGQPLLRPDATTLVALAVLVATGAAAAAVVFRRGHLGANRPATAASASLLSPAAGSAGSR